MSKHTLIYYVGGSERGVWRATTYRGSPAQLVHVQAQVELQGYATAVIPEDTELPTAAPVWWDFIALRRKVEEVA